MCFKMFFLFMYVCYIVNLLGVDGGASPGGSHVSR